MPRKTLPPRRPTARSRHQFRNQTIFVDIGYDPDTLTPLEVFASCSKTTSDLALLMQDACVLVSLALQHGVPPQALAKSLGTVPGWSGEQEHASVIGLIVEAVQLEGALMEEARVAG